MHVYKVCGSEAAQDYMLQMALQSRFRKTLDACSSMIQSLNQHEPLQMSPALGWVTVFLAVLWVRQGSCVHKCAVGNSPTVVVRALSSWTREGANITFLSSTENQVVRFITSFYENLEIQCKMGFKLLEIRKYNILN